MPGRSDVNNAMPVGVIEIAVNDRVLTLLTELKDSGLFGDSVQQVVERLVCERIRTIYDEHELIRGEDEYPDPDDDDDDEGIPA